MIKLLLSTLLLFSLSGCSQKLSDYRGLQPKLDLKQFFQGHLVAHGIVQGFDGQVTRQFRAELQAKWRGNEGVLDEVFYFADGEVSTRCWRLTKQGDQYVGSADDVEGVASGAVAGNVLNWSYYLKVPVDDSEYTFWLDDWLYLIDESNLLNRTDMKMWGITVAELTLSIRKLNKQEPVELSANCQLAGEHVND